MTSKNYGSITDLDTLKKLIDKLWDDDKPIGYDIETGYDGPDKKKGALFPAGNAYTVGFSITNDQSWARYVPLRHDYGVNLDPDEVWPLLKPLFEEKKLLVAHHAKFESKFAKQVGINLNILADTMLITYVLSEYPGFGLKDLVFNVFQHKMAEITTLFPNATKKQLEALRFNVLDPSNPDVVAYACDDAAQALALFYKFDKRAQVERPLMYKLEHQISDIMAEAELWGTGVDWEAMKIHRAYADPFRGKYEAYVKEALGQMAGRTLLNLNLKSSKQVQALLYGELGLSTTTKTKSGADSTGAQALETLSKDYPAIKALVQLHEIDNLLLRHVKWLEEKPGEVPIKGRDGRVHANYGQAIVGSGRFAANDPAIQQLPKDWFWALPPYCDWVDAAKTDEELVAVKAKIKAEAPKYTYWMGNFRDYIVPAEGWYFLSYDYSQIELRMVAGLSQEPALLKAFNEGTDVHKVTAGLMLNKEISAVTKADRDIGKTFNFALVYGMGIKSLSERLAVSLDRAKELYALYFAGFASIKTWMGKAKDEGTAKGYSVSYFGRKCTVWELKSSNRAIRAKADRILGNVPVQGAAADYMKIAMQRAVAALKKKGWWGTKVKLVANLHDALTFEVHESLSPDEVRAVLEPAVVFQTGPFPKIVADWEMGYTWGSSASWKKDKAPIWDGAKWTFGAVMPPEEPVAVAEPVAVEVVPTVPVEAQPPASVDCAPSSTEPGKTIIVELERMPDSDQFERFLDLLNVRLGSNTVVLRTPEGDVPIDKGTSLGLIDQPRISMILGGAVVYLPPQDVDDKALLAGLVF